MFEKLYNRLWIRPQLIAGAWLSSAGCDCNWGSPEVLFNKKGAAAIAIGFTDFFICEIAFLILGIADEYRWEDSKRCKGIEQYIEDKGIIKSKLSSADEYYYLKKFITSANKYIEERGHSFEPNELEEHRERVREAEEKMKEVYEEALILELSGVEKGF